MTSVNALQTLDKSTKKRKISHSWYVAKDVNMSTILAKGNIKLTPKQQAFVNEYLICKNGAEAARRAKYKGRSARQIAAENLTKPAVLAAIALKTQEMAHQYEFSKDRVIAELQASIKVAETKFDAGAMIRGWIEIAKIMGFYAPEVVELAIPNESRALRTQYEALSDNELLAIINGNTVISN